MKKLFLLSANCERRVSTNPQLEVARMIDTVGEATRQAALDGICCALSIAAAPTMDTPDRARDIANQVLSRAVIMQCEINRFIAITHGRGRR